ncbi:MAG: hypothetical protein K1Y36_29510 [Blastocatellia bacterium]|nr:hypothetical protein [Blastocatellia bacterium]
MNRKTYGVQLNEDEKEKLFSLVENKTGCRPRVVSTAVRALILVDTITRGRPKSPGGDRTEELEAQVTQLQSVIEGLQKQLQDTVSPNGKT